MVDVAPLPNFSGAARFYLVWRLPSAGHLSVGIWYCHWGLITRLLRGSQLFGSGTALKGFSNVDDAIAHNRTSVKFVVPADRVNIFTQQQCENVYQRVVAGTQVAE